MKRLLMLLLTALLATALVGCGTNEPATEPPEVVEEEAPEEEAAPEEDAATEEEATEEEAAPEEDAMEEEATEEAAVEEATEEAVPEEEATEEPAGGAQSQEEPAAGDGGLLATVIERGTLLCGVNGSLPGFSNLEADGTYSGFDADFCRATAAALFGDPDAVEFVPLSAQERFTAVQTGNVDVLFRNTTWTLSRDTSVFMDFAPITFYDGQGIMVREELGIADLEGLEGATICVQSGTTTELNLTDQFRARGITFEPVVFEEIDPTYNAYDEARCDAVTSDRSQLIARRTTLQEPEAHVILDAVLSKEPLAPAVAQGDSQWKDVIDWVVFSTIQAEEFGITSENLGEFIETEDPNIARFLGLEGDLGAGLGLEATFTQNILLNVGNYGEIYDRNLGPETPFDLARGQNSLWTDGGLLYAPPFR